MQGKQYVGNPHVWFDEEKIASAATPRRGSLLYKAIQEAMKNTWAFCVAAILCNVVSYGALTNMDYVNETWSLVWDGAPVTSLSRNVKTYFYCHWESSLGRRMAADIHVCESPANAIKYPGAVQAIEPTANGNCTYWIMRTDYSVPFDDIKRVYSVNVGGSSSGGGSSSVYHQIEKPTLYVNPGSTNIYIRWSIGKQTDNSPIKAEIYRRQGEASSNEASYQLVYSEYDSSNIRVTNGPVNENEWVDTSVKLGVTYTYYVRVYGQGGSIDYSNSYAKTGATTDILYLLRYENLKGATHQNPDYWVTCDTLTLTEPSAVPGYTFTGWTTEADYSARILTKTANWEDSRYTVRYNSNDGNEFVVEYPAQYNTNFVIRANMFARSGYAFQGWATESAGEVVYATGTTVSNLTDVSHGVVNLYAVWRPYERCDVQISEVSVETLQGVRRYQINYTLSNAIDSRHYGLRFLYVVGGQTNEIVNFEGGISLDAGENSVIWNAEEDDIAVGQLSEVFVVITGVGSVGDAIEQEYFSSKKYCIINLEGNDDLGRWAIQYTNDIPSGGWTDEYKTSRLVLRRCPAGEFYFGSDEMSTNLVRLTKDFYIGVFEISQGQYLRITGSSPSVGVYWECGPMHPVFDVSYDNIRGAELGAEWPSSSRVDDSSFIGILRENTGLLFDLPTEAQWEYACRAQTPTCYSYSYGYNPDGDYMWYEDNSEITIQATGYTYRKAYMHEVGTKKPNQWGLYDMHGNVGEWCLDWIDGEAPFRRMYGEDPVGLSWGWYRVIRGGNYSYTADDCKSWSCRTFRPGNGVCYYGFRVVINDCSNEPECLRRMVTSVSAHFVKPENSVFTPASGTIFDGSLSVSISCPTEGAVIHYTTDGTDPTIESPVYRRFRITGKTTVKAVADIDGMLSDVVTAEYALGQCATPAISLANGASFAHSNQVVSIQWDNDGVLRYTLDGSEPTAESPIYDEPFAINDSTTIKAKVFSDTFFDSPVVTASVTRVWETMTPPVIGVAAIFTGTRTEVVISNEMDGATIFYTLDGSEPNSLSAKYTEPFYVTDNCTIKAYAVLSDYLDSMVATANVTRIWENVATPQIEASSSFTGSKTKVSISCATEGAVVRYTLNGNEPNSHSTKYTGPFYVTNSCTVKAYAVMPDYLNSEVATFAIEKVWVIGDTMGKPDHGFTTGGDGDAGWTRVTDTTAPNGEAMKSGAITHDQESVLETKVMGSGTLTFSWRTSCEDSGGLYDWDHAEFAVDGVVLLWRDGINSWANESVRIESGGEHTVTWTYKKDDVESDGEDVAYVAGYGWASDYTETQTTEVPVPYAWLTAHDPDVVDEYDAYEAAAKKTAANGHNKVWECYVAGISQTNETAKFTASIEMADGVPQIKWSPNLNTNGIERTYTIWGKTNLTDGVEWECPTNSAHRFFKVMVEMP